MSHVDVSIVMVSYNCQSWLERCLGSLDAALGDLTAELIVVDNASSDGSADAVVANRPDAVVVRNADNAGFARAVNQGAALANSDWILLLNPDTECRPGSLAALKAFAEARPGHGIYGGRTLNPDGTVQPSSCWALPTLWSTACFALGLSTLMPRSALFDPESMGRWDRDSVREVGMVTGCLLLVPREVWRELGGLDEKYFVYGEDADLAARARLRGYKPIITPTAEIVHAVGVSSSTSGAKTALLLAGKITFARDHLGRGAVAAVELTKLGVFVRALAARLLKKDSKWASAWAVRASWRNGFV